MPPVVLTLHIESGSRRGEVVRFGGDRVTVGRHPEADLRFGPETDLEVSARHAVLARDEHGWFVRDLGSRNGTWIGIRRVEGDRRLRDGDTLHFGTGGPRCRVKIEEPSAEGDATPPTRTTPGASVGGSLTRRIRVEVSRRTRLLTAIVSLLALALVVGFAAVGITWNRRASAWQEERHDLEARLDSILRASEGTAGLLGARIEGLSEALEQSRDRVRAIREELERSRDAGTAEARELRTRLQAATAALERQQIAASLDFDAIQDLNGNAVAQVYVERSDGSVVTGTAFAVRSDATLATARHMVSDDGDVPPVRRIAVQFAGSEQVWPARVVRLDPAVDLALIRARNIAGGVPTVAGLATRRERLPPGSPVAILGFPLGGAGDGGNGSSAASGPPRPLLSAGVVDRNDGGLLEIQGYGERGASGSPVFDAAGRVVGVVYGGRTLDDGGRRLVGVPVEDLVRLLAEIPETER